MITPEQALDLAEYWIGKAAENPLALGNETRAAVGHGYATLAQAVVDYLSYQRSCL